MASEPKVATLVSVMRVPTPARLRGYYNYVGAHLCFRRPIRIKKGVPLISFTFDDFPRSAWLTGGAIMKEHGIKGTYYAAFGLMCSHGPSGEMFQSEDVRGLLEEGHELGCHTFGHEDSQAATSAVFEESIMKNRQAFQSLVPGGAFITFSYPFGFPSPRIKKKSRSYFACCRSGGQAFNSGIADLNNLAAYFLEQSREDPAAIKDVIDRNSRANGWLIFATHDIAADPSKYGCTPELFDEVVQHATRSGSRILPVAEALEHLKGRI